MQKAKKLENVQLITLMNSNNKIGNIEIYPKDYKSEITKRTIESLKQIEILLSEAKEESEKILLRQATKDILNCKIIKITPGKGQEINLKQEEQIKELKGVKKWLSMLTA